MKSQPGTGYMRMNQGSYYTILPDSLRTQMSQLQLRIDLVGSYCKRRPHSNYTALYYKASCQYPQDKTNHPDS